MSTMFLSYSRHSETVVGALVADIESLGHRVWFDKEVSGGQAWWDQILEQIRRCDVFVLALSPETLSSAACQREHSYAVVLKKPILPVVVADGVAPSLLPPALSQVQLVQYKNRDAAEALRLARAIAALPAAPPLPDPLPDPPEIPTSYLGRLAAKVDSTTILNFDEQSGVLFDLRRGLNEPAARDASRELLTRLRKRRDLFASIAEEIDSALQADGPKPPPPPNEVPPAPQTRSNDRVGPPRSERRPLSRRSVLVQLAAWSLLLAVSLAGVWLWRDRFAGAPLDRTALRVGILMKPEWDVPARAVESAFKEVFAKLTHRLADQNVGYAFKPEIRTFVRSDEVIEALQLGEIDLAGELSPKDIYDADQRAGAQPFISPEYGGSPTYIALFFTSSAYPLDTSETGELKPKTWQKILLDLKRGDGLLAVSNQSSTAGYWYPRKRIVQEIGTATPPREFADVSLHPEDGEPLDELVACRRRKVVAGATAAYRLRDGGNLFGKKYRCSGVDVHLVPIMQSEAIPQGAFVVRAALAGQSTFLSGLTANWGASMAEVFSSPDLSSLKIPNVWAPVSPRSYSVAYATFNEPDPVSEGRTARQRRIVAFSGVVALVASLLYVFVKSRSREVHAGTNESRAL